MPGIVGLISTLPRERAEAELLRMVESLRHESFYVTGTWIDAELGVYVGWVARKGSFADGMPLRNVTGDIVLVFSGEEFPGPGIMARLKGRGHTVDKDSSSYLVRLAEEDPSFPRGLNGWFHGLLIDRTKGTAVLFNDRYGMHRLYYHEAREAFYFAAEAKAILAVRPELRSTDTRGLAEFISCGCTLQSRTIFQGVHVLASASAWTFRRSLVERKAVYFEPREWEQQSTLEPELYYQQLRDTFARILPGYFGGPERVGISLTGGLDSRMIMAWHRAGPGTLPCYTFGGMFRDSQDVAIARKIARVWGQEHEVIPVGEEFLSRFAHFAERTVFLTDGCVEVKHSPDLYANELAARIAPVRMTGNYGGEVLRQVRAFKPVDPVPGLFHPDLSAPIQGAAATYRSLLQEEPLSFALFRQATWHHYGLLKLEQSQLSLRSPFLDNELVRLVYCAPKSTLASNDLSLRLIEDGNPALRRIRTDRGLGGSFPGFAADLRRMYYEFTFKAEYAYDYGMTQSLAQVDHAFSGLHLERLFLGRHKFYHFRVWYRDALANYIREILLDSRALSRPYLQRVAVERLVKGHVKGDRNYTTAIHRLLTLEHLHRLFLDSK
jgi:asparagine synthase (glutamine-hydrolysing)